MLVDLKVRDSERAKEILAAIAEKEREISNLCYELHHCLAVEATVKKEQPEDCSE